MAPRGSVTCLVCVLLSCAREGPSVAQQHATILSSSADTTSTDVFLLDVRFDNGRSGICSATLISSRVLLTAGHCIDAKREGAKGFTVRATNVPDALMLRSTDLLDVTDTQVHPGYSGEGPRDLALLLLAQPAPATPRPLLRTPPSSWSGAVLRLVGYGRTAVNVSDSGTRRSGEVSVTTATADTLGFGAAGSMGICSGDSGGAGLFRGADGVERLAGVHSYGTSSQCGVGGDVRVDTQLSFIDAFLEARDPASCAGGDRCRSDCATPDPDCTADCSADGHCTAEVCASPDPDCAPEGAACASSESCSSRQCIAQDGADAHYCSRICSSSAECAEPMECSAGLCRKPTEASQTVQGGCAAVPLAGTPLLLLVWWARARRRNARHGRSSSLSNTTR